VQYADNQMRHPFDNYLRLSVRKGADLKIQQTARVSCHLLHFGSSGPGHTGEIKRSSTASQPSIRRVAKNQPVASSRGRYLDNDHVRPNRQGSPAAEAVYVDVAPTGAARAGNLISTATANRASGIQSAVVATHGDSPFCVRRLPGTSSKRTSGKPPPCWPPLTLRHDVRSRRGCCLHQLRNHSLVRPRPDSAHSRLLVAAPKSGVVTTLCESCQCKAGGHSTHKDRRCAATQANTFATTRTPLYPPPPRFFSTHLFCPTRAPSDSSPPPSGDRPAAQRSTHVTPPTPPLPPWVPPAAPGRQSPSRWRSSWRSPSPPRPRPRPLPANPSTPTTVPLPNARRRTRRVRRSRSRPCAWCA